MIKRVRDFLHKCFECPVAIASGMIGISVVALGGAFSSEIFLKLEPCQFCIYQRWPYAIAIVIGIFILFLRKSRRAVIGLTALGSLTFLINSAIAAFHTGIELHWWKSPVEGCSVPASFLNEDQSWIDNIMSIPSGSCDEIPWADPILGLSMANYNALLCAGVFLCCVYAAIRLKRSAQ